MASLPVIRIEITFTPAASVLLRELLAAIREGDVWQYQDVLERLEQLEPLLQDLGSAISGP